ncbi:MAG: head-tail connector protein [Planctomycetota bacterium]
MNYAVNVLTEPTQEPVSLSEAKLHLRVPTDHEDVNISGIYLPAARRRVEAELGRQLMTATLTLTLDAFPPGTCPMPIPMAPLQSITSIIYRDIAGTETTMPAEDYVVDSRSEPGRVMPSDGVTWPSVKDRVVGSTVLVTFVAGYGPNESDVPAPIRQAILLLLGHYYYHREEVVMGVNTSVLPRAVSDLLASQSIGDEFENYSGRDAYRYGGSY